MLGGVILLQQNDLFPPRYMTKSEDPSPVRELEYFSHLALSEDGFHEHPSLPTRLQKVAGEYPISLATLPE